jgi:hypothetical protein
VRVPGGLQPVSLRDGALMKTDSVNPLNRAPDLPVSWYLQDWLEVGSVGALGKVSPYLLSMQV